MGSARAAASPRALHGLGSSPKFVPSAWVSTAHFAATRAHPELSRSVASFAASMIDIYSGHALLNKVLCDRGRILVGLFVLYLDVLPLPGTQECGASLSAVQTLCSRTGVCSRGRAASVLAALRFGGYIAPRADPKDHRRRILVPAHKLIAAHQLHWVRQFEAMVPVFPNAALVPARLNGHGFRTAFLHELGAHFFAGFRVLDHAPILAELAESNAGLLTLSSFALPVLAGVARPGEAVTISISALSRRFCVSRGHIRNMLVVSQRAGLLDHTRGSDTLVVLPPLVEALIQFYAVLFILFNRCAAGAWRNVGVSDVPIHSISASGMHRRSVGEMM